jgi:hypothetical protein
MAADPYEMQRAMAGLRVLVQRRMTAALRVVAEQYPGDPRRFRDAAIGVMQNLTRQHGAQAGVFAAQWYNALRTDARVRGRYVAVGWIGDYDEQIAQTIRRAVAGLFTDAPDLEHVFQMITEKAGKYVTDTGWETVRRNANRDPESSGWSRTAVGETCDFCLMLVGRGGVYTRESVQFRSHTKCNCGAVPSWDPNAIEVPDIAYRASASTSSMSREERHGHNERIQDWIERNRDSLDELRAELAA